MEKPTKSFWQIWNVSFGFFGIQFGWGLQMANMSAIYEYLGARADQIPILWLVSHAGSSLRTCPWRNPTQSQRPSLRRYNPWIHNFLTPTTTAI
jgi:hypothetical protein